MAILLIESGKVVGWQSGLPIEAVQANNPTLTAVEDTFGISYPMGMDYDPVNGLTGTPNPPPEPVAPPPPPPETRHITQLAFLNRFTDAEAIAIDLASQGATVQAAAMRRYQSKVSAATYIDLDRQDTRDGVLALETAGLLGTGRALIILDDPIQAEEKAK